ncbi:putative tRNA-m1A22 methylase [Lachnospiraceae bacterium TWA4]|nr:putative tRNA-m1A22 methylase [Lachnospiraceae bacterium TWA4]
MELSKRLQKIADFVCEGKVLADIGTDHAHLPIWLIKNHKIPKAYALDIGVGPLERAKEAIHIYGLEEVIEPRLSDGMKELKEGEVQTVVIAGMGGPLICKILDERKDLWSSIDEFILSPQSELKETRQYLRANGFIISREEMVFDMGKYYTVLKVIKQSEVEDLYGAYLLEHKDPVLYEYLLKERQTKEQILKNLPESASKRKQELEKELNLNTLAIRRYE